MSDIASQESTSTEEVQEPTGTEPQVEDHSTSTEEPKANPFWSEVESRVGPNVYKTISPFLAQADAEANKRISAVNQSYAPWKAFADQGIQPAQVQQALGVVQQLNSSPEQVFESLRSFLEREGRMPSKAELTQEVIEDEGDDPQVQEDPRLAALEEQNRQIREYLEGQQLAAQRAQADGEADNWLKSEVEKLKDPKFGYDEADIQEIVRIAAFQAQQTGADPENLDAAAQQFNALRDRIRTTPRPGQLAPRLPSGPGGGSPSGGTIDASNLTPQQRRELSMQVMARAKSS